MQEGIVRGFLLAAVVHDDAEGCHALRGCGEPLATTLQAALTEYAHLTREEKKSFIAHTTKSLAPNLDSIAKSHGPQRWVAFLQGVPHTVPTREGFVADKGLQRTIRRFMSTSSQTP